MFFNVADGSVVLTRKCVSHCRKSVSLCRLPLHSHWYCGIGNLFLILGSSVIGIFSCCTTSKRFPHWKLDPIREYKMSFVRAVFPSALHVMRDFIS